MGRQPQPALKQELLEACTDHVLAHGLPDRLAPLVHATGTSARMLIYHFGSKEEILRQVLRQARTRQLEAFGELLRARPGEPYGVTLHRAWVAISGADGRPYLQVFGAHSGVDSLWPGFRRSATTDWLGPLEEGLASLGRPELATLVLAVIRGLLLDLDATGDTARADRAFLAFLDALAEPSALPRA